MGKWRKEEQQATTHGQVGGAIHNEKLLLAQSSEDMDNVLVCQSMRSCRLQADSG